MNPISFTIPGEPVAKGRARSTVRAGFVHHYTPEKTRKAEESLTARAFQFRPKEPLDCPLRLTVAFVFPVPASWPRWKREAALRGEYLHVTKPDADNCIKLLKDSFNGVFWVDDRQIWGVVAVKMYGPAPLVNVRIEPCVQAIAPARAVKGEPQ